MEDYVNYKQQEIDRLYHIAVDGENKDGMKTIAGVPVWPLSRVFGTGSEQLTFKDAHEFQLIAAALKLGYKNGKAAAESDKNTAEDLKFLKSEFERLCDQVLELAKLFNEHLKRSGEV